VETARVRLDETTVDGRGPTSDHQAPALPGALIVWSMTTPMLHALPLRDGVRRVGRTDGPDGPLRDAAISREHVELRWQDGAWSIRDLDSRNGTFVDGQRIKATRLVGPGCLRLSETLLLLIADVSPFVGRRMVVDDERVAGPSFEAALMRARRAAAAGDTLLISGESGTGKELVARAFHRDGPRAAGPFVATNCAAIPSALAESLLFGARKGAYSGAHADSDGYLQAAAGGVLFLDEVGELELSTQAKLLRAIETREVQPLGAVRPRPVDVQICCATHRSLPDRVRAGQFREDLLFRISQSTVSLPPLRERREEIPWLIAAVLGQVAEPRADARLVEQCLLRHWPGNVRQLLSAVRAAAREAPPGRPARLPDGVGDALTATEAPPPANARPPEPTRAQIEESLEAHRGNVAATARALGLQRTALYRLMKTLGVQR
jgi:DNA-binding NtrC family response regulator